MNLENENEIDTEELVLTEEDEVQTLEEDQDEADEPETVIGFADDTEAAEDDTPLVKRLRDQLREAQRQNRRPREVANDTDPEPVIPDEPNEEEVGWDFDEFRKLQRAREAAIIAHAEWKQRQSKRDDARRTVQDEQARKIEQQKNALGVSDYDARSSVVKEVLSEGQLAVLINGADNPAQVIYALGRSQSRLDMLAGEQNLARFAVMLGKMEKDIKVSKRTAPAPDTQVRGATGNLAPSGGDKKLAALEKEAEKTGDRSKIAAYRREQRRNAA